VIEVALTALRSLTHVSSEGGLPVCRSQASSHTVHTVVTVLGFGSFHRDSSSIKARIIVGSLDA
jgi:hypothetical protein